MYIAIDHNEVGQLVRFKRPSAFFFKPKLSPVVREAANGHPESVMYFLSPPQEVRVETWSGAWKHHLPRAIPLRKDDEFNAQLSSYSRMK